MAYLLVEDLQGTVEVIVFPELYAVSIQYLEGDIPLLISGTLDKGEKGFKIKATKIASLLEMRERMTSRIDIRLTGIGASADDLAGLKEVFLRHKGETPVHLKLNIQHHGSTLLSIKTAKEHYVNPTENFVNDIEHLLGPGAVSFV